MIYVVQNKLHTSVLSFIRGWQSYKWQVTIRRDVLMQIFHHIPGASSWASEQTISETLT